MSHTARRNRRTALSMLVVLAFPAVSLAAEELWLDPRCERLPSDKMGPFVHTASGEVLALDSEATYVSDDGGKTWSEPRPLFPERKNLRVRPERALLRTRSGVVIAAFSNEHERHWTWDNRLRDAPGAKLPTYVMRSLDDGKTWQDIEKLHDDWTGAVRDMIQTRDGRVVFTSMKLLHDPGRHAVVTYSSSDDGKTWQAGNVIDLGGAGHHGGVTEGTLTQLQDGRLWMLLRTNWGEFWSGYSLDGGRFWRILEPSGIAASSAPGLLKRLESGRLLLVWNRAFPAGKHEWPLTGGDGQWSEVPVSNHREELSIAFSSDDGKTWSEPVVVARQKGRWLAYPYVFEYEPGRLWLTTMQGDVRVELRESDFLRAGRADAGEPSDGEIPRDQLHRQDAESRDGTSDAKTGVSHAEALWSQLAPHFSPPEEFLDDFGTYATPLKFRDDRDVKTADDWKRRRQQLLAEWHEMLGPWPELLERPRIKILETERRENFTQHRVQVEIAPGEKYTEGHLLIPDGDGRRPAVLVPFYESATSVGLGERGRGTHDYGLQLARRGFVTLSIGTPGSIEQPDKGTRDLLVEAGKQQPLQPLSYLAYVAANCHTALANRPEVDSERIGIVGLSYGGKWAMFASCLYDKFACAVWSDPGIVFDENNPNVNYWEPWYLGYEPGTQRPAGIPNDERPRTGLYKRLFESGRDLNELHPLMCPRPLLVAGGTEDPPRNWRALNHLIDVNKVLGHSNRVGMTHRKTHVPTPEALEKTLLFFEYFLKYHPAAT